MLMDRAELARRLKEKVDFRYFIFGKELFLVERCCSIIREHAKEQGYSERIVMTANADFDWQLLNDYLTEQSLFASRKLIELRLPASGRPGQQGAAALTACLDNQNSDAMVLVIGGAIDSSARSSKWFKQCVQEATAVDNRELNFREFQEWIKSFFDRNGFTYDREVISRFAYYFEGNMLAAANEMRKLKLSHDESRLTLERFEQMVVDQARFNVFSLTDACLAGDSARGVRLLHSLKTEGVEPVVVLMTMAREARIVYKIAVATDRRLPLAQIFKELRIWKSRENLIREAAGRLGVGGSARCLRRLARVDRIVKGRDDPPVGGSIWYEFERIILEMCRSRAKPTAPARFARVR
ncbi:MAG: DNA polymerase III subunit delta [Acidiferrobacterales bacterium]|nr:DNA polymerase III subunit delta [Acidiferrobacterales bacterium]